MVKNLLFVFLCIPQEIISEKHEKDRLTCTYVFQWITLNFVARIFSPAGLVARPVDLGQMLLNERRKDTPSINHLFITNLLVLFTRQVSKRSVKSS